MKLSTSRLCLDCNEVYEEAGCPACGSEAFAYLTRWVPPSDQRPQPRPATSPAAAAYRGLLAPEASQPRRSTVIKNAIVGVATVGVLSWVWQLRRTAKNRQDGP